jgi:D-xylose reductase
MNDAAIVPLANGDKMPSIGLGLWKVECSKAADTVEQAARIGFRHFDSAYDYGNEPDWGEGLQKVLRARICRREELWITHADVLVG